MERLKQILNWEKDNAWAWLFKCLALTCGTLFVCTNPGLVILFLLTLFAWIFIRPIIQKYNDDAMNVQDTEAKTQWANTIREVMFWFLHGELGKLLTVQKPESVDDITSSSFPIYKNVKGLDIYRFSVFYGYEKDINNLHTLTRNYVTRHIQEGNIPELPKAMYKDVPALYVLNVRLDPYEPGYMMILVTYIDNDDTYSYVKQLEQRQAKRKNSGIQHPNDVEF